MARRGDQLSLNQELAAADNSPVQYDFVTPQYDSSNFDAINPNHIHLTDDDDDEEFDEETEEEEADRYSRPRSRSKSFNEHDGDVTIPVLNSADPNSMDNTAGWIDPNKIVPVVGSGQTPKQEPVERSGPLQQREVLALKKVIY